jgi:hypothetical protein
MRLCMQALAGTRLQTADSVFEMVWERGACDNGEARIIKQR